MSEAGQAIPTRAAKHFPTQEDERRALDKGIAYESRFFTLSRGRVTTTRRVLSFRLFGRLYVVPLWKVKP